MTFEACYSIMSAAVLDAGIGVGNEGALEQFVGIVEIQMVHYSVPEVSRENLPLLRVFDNEAGGRGGPISTGPEFVTQYLETVVHIVLEVPLICTAALVPTRIKICPMKVSIQLGLCNLHKKQRKDALRNRYGKC